MATKKCEPCELSGFSIGAALILIAIIAAVVLVVAGGLKIWEAFPAMHALRCSFQPLRIAVTYAQVTSQLGDVLNFNLPPVFASVIDALKPITQFPAFQVCQCFESIHDTRVLGCHIRSLFGITEKVIEFGSGGDRVVVLSRYAVVAWFTPQHGSVAMGKV